MSSIFNGPSPGSAGGTLSALGLGPNIGDLLSQALDGMKRANLTVEQEMQAYQRDQNATHLFNVISLLQQVIAEQQRTMQPVAQIGSTLEGVFRALQPGLPGPSLPPPVLNAIGGMVGKAALPDPAPPPGLGAGGPATVQQLSAQMSRMSKLMELLSTMARAQQETARGVIQNLR